jgi:hypothetical protein
MRVGIKTLLIARGRASRDLNHTNIGSSASDVALRRVAASALANVCGERSPEETDCKQNENTKDLHGIKGGRGRLACTEEDVATCGSRVVEEKKKD